MRFFLRLPPLLRVLLLLGTLLMLTALGVMLAGLGVMIWAPLIFYREWDSVRVSFGALALLDLGGAWIWPVAAYNLSTTGGRHPHHAMTWLSSGRGQFISAAVASILPITALVVLLVLPVHSPVFSWAQMFCAWFPLAFWMTVFLAIW